MKRMVLILAIALLAAPAADATQVLFRTPQQLGSESQLVVQGRVTAVESYWNAARTSILTETRILVGETYKGSGGGVVRVVQLGGTVGNVRVSVHGALQWRVDEEVVLFLEPAGGNAWQVSGFTQGKFSVERDERGRAFVARPATDGAQLVGASGDALTAARVQRVGLQRFVDDALSGSAKGGDQR